MIIDTYLGKHGRIKDCEVLKKKKKTAACDKLREFEL